MLSWVCVIGGIGDSEGLGKIERDDELEVEEVEYEAED